MFMRAYMDRMTPDFVNLSIGLRAPQLYEETSSLIMKVPQAFLSAFTEYLHQFTTFTNNSPFARQGISRFS